VALVLTLCLSTISNCLQAKPTHQNIIRLAPPLVISEAEIRDALRIIGEAIEELPNLKGEKEDEVIPSSEKGVHIGLDD
jgi:ornithine--oxo-acid transaminase